MKDDVPVATPPERSSHPSSLFFGPVQIGGHAEVDFGCGAERLGERGMGMDGLGQVANRTAQLDR